MKLNISNAESIAKMGEFVSIGDICIHTPSKEYADKLYDRMIKIFNDKEHGKITPQYITISSKCCQVNGDIIK